MRHNVFGRKLNRDIKSRQILFRQLIIALIEKGKIETTDARAKAIKDLVDKLVNKARSNKLNSQRSIQGFLGKINTFEKFINSVVPRLGNKTSGFTRIIKLNNRKGDNAPMVQLEFIQKEDSKSQPDEKKKENKSVKTIDQKSKESRRKSGNKTNENK